MWYIQYFKKVLTLLLLFCFLPFLPVRVEAISVKTPIVILDNVSQTEYPSYRSNKDGVWRIFGKDISFEIDYQRVSGWFIVDGYLYYSESGYCLTGLQQIGNKVFYFDEAGKAMRGVLTRGNSLYIFKEDGEAIYSTTKEKGVDKNKYNLYAQYPFECVMYENGYLKAWRTKKDVERFPDTDKWQIYKADWYGNSEKRVISKSSDRIANNAINTLNWLNKNHTTLTKWFKDKYVKKDTLTTDKVVALYQKMGIEATIFKGFPDAKKSDVDIVTASGNTYIVVEYAISYVPELKMSVKATDSIVLQYNVDANKLEFYYTSTCFDSRGDVIYVAQSALSGYQQKYVYTEKGKVAKAYGSYAELLQAEYETLSELVNAQGNWRSSAPRLFLQVGKPMYNAIDSLTAFQDMSDYIANQGYSRITAYFLNMDFAEFDTINNMRSCVVTDSKGNKSELSFTMTETQEKEYYFTFSWTFTFEDGMQICTTQASLYSQSGQLKQTGKREYKVIKGKETKYYASWEDVLYAIFGKTGW